MQNNDFHLLMKLGFSERQAKVYLALLNQRNATAAELQKSSGIIKTKVYEIVKSLVQKGYCRERKVGRKRTFEAVDPQFSLSSYIPKLESHINDTRLMIKRLSERFAESSEETEPLDYIEVLYGNDNVHRKFVSLLRSCAKEFLGFARAPYACYTEEMIAEQIRENIAFLDRGGKIRTVYELNEKSPDWLMKFIEMAAKAGEDFRISEELPLKMIIFDRETTLLADEGGFASEGELTMSAIKQKVTVNGYVALFEFFWNQSMELEEWEKTNG